MDPVELVKALDAGGVVIIPTDTVYGLAARLDRPEAIARIFELKGRDQVKALPVLGTDRAALDQIAVFDDRSEILCERFWPGPLTLVLERAASFTADLGGDGLGVAVRVPEHELTRSLLRSTGPLAVTSANPSGQPDAVDAGAARALFPELPLLDGGPGLGMPSTVLSLLGEPTILRPGTIAAEVLSAIR